jgi:NADPH-dependent 2,4-dienoyl-CoA reductase/sulfur reductase-like enzyme
LRRILVAGAGLAGLHAAQTLRRSGFDGDLLVVGDEPAMPYDRPPLSKQLLAGKIDPAECRLPCDGLEAEWRTGCAAVRLDSSRRVVELDDGSDVEYDGLVIATGRRARTVPTPDLEGFFMLRTLEDSRALGAAARQARRVVVVGAGFIGCEVAATLRSGGTESITLVDIADQPMPPIGQAAGARAKEFHEEHGVTFELGVGVEEYEGEGRVEAVRLADGRRIEADLVLVAVGAAPNTEWLQDSGLEFHQGCVRCDEHCFAVGADGVVAVGDMAAWPHPQAEGLVAVEHWTNARDMARAGAANLLARPEDRTPYVPVPSFWSDQYDVKIKSLGFLKFATSFDVVEDDPAQHRLVVEAHKDGDLVGVVLFNRNRLTADYQRMLSGSAAAV